MEQQRSHGQVNHVFRNINPLLIVPHQASVTHQPCKRSLDHPAPWLNGETSLPLQAPHYFHCKVEKRCLVHQLSAVVCCIPNRCFTHGQRLIKPSSTIWALVESAISAGVRFTVSKRPSVSTAIWRLRPLSFCWHHNLTFARFAPSRSGYRQCRHLEAPPVHCTSGQASAPSHGWCETACAASVVGTSNKPSDRAGNPWPAGTIRIRTAPCNAAHYGCSQIRFARSSLLACFDNSGAIRRHLSCFTSVG